MASILILILSFTQFSYSLNEFFSKEHTGRDDLFKSLKAVLEEVPDAVAEACDENVMFIAEQRKSSTTSSNSKEIQSLRSTQAKLKAQLTSMQKATKKIYELERDIEKSVTGKLPTASPSKNRDNANKVLSKKFEDKLISLEKHCDKLSKETSEKTLSKVKDAASASQQKLYEIYQKARFETAPGTGGAASKKTQDLIKGLQ